MSQPSILSRARHYRVLLATIDKLRSTNPEQAERKMNYLQRNDPGFQHWYRRFEENKAAATGGEV